MKYMRCFLDVASGTLVGSILGGLIVAIYGVARVLIPIMCGCCAFWTCYKLHMDSNNQDTEKGPIFDENMVIKNSKGTVLFDIDATPYTFIGFCTCIMDLFLENCFLVIVVSFIGLVMVKKEPQHVRTKATTVVIYGNIIFLISGIMSLF